MPHVSLSLGLLELSIQALYKRPREDGDSIISHCDSNYNTHNPSIATSMEQLTGCAFVTGGGKRPLYS